MAVEVRASADDGDGWVIMDAVQQAAARAKAGAAGRGFFPTPEASAAAAKAAGAEEAIQQLTAEVQWLRGEWLRATELQEAAEANAAKAAAVAEAQRKELARRQDALDADTAAAAQRVRDDEATLQVPPARAALPV
jgi:hypothetical protein